MTSDRTAFRAVRGAPRRRHLAVTALLVAALLGGCEQGTSWQRMAVQPRYDPLEPSTFFEDGLSARQPVPGTVARGHLREDEHLYGGHADGRHAATFPFPVTAEVVARGRERFDVYCSPCHGRTGYGNGMIVQRGFLAPPSFHLERLRSAPVGHFVHVMTAGFGAMPSYAKQVSAPDRWAIAAYVRALQLSQHAPAAAVPDGRRAELERGGP